ncbi:RagB/SusD family nutrient uptake outer membrane protein [Galbibacter sp. BG1]|uniref:RagB/SusD family nutrient uptake outer membrane protein n=1 Tax=Galbibacter sp. BG1 TaxID=1170699 RepID=UPI0015B98068|nr:RagB/SusD family nutrient uptake outer membrane protein [Galbibacter sp. BG1]QLE01991.1 RagB/SusD family nutrient uptake outer membrane protein [Galbibacter sp. BG1]
MKSIIYIKRIVAITIYCCLFSCEDFVEVDVPNSKIVSETVFNNDETAIAAMKGIYNELYRASFSRGDRTSVTVLSGLSSDNLEVIGTNNLSELEFGQNEILPSNANNLDLWSSAYNIIYMANSLLEGVENSQNMTAIVSDRLNGEAKFVRAFAYFYLVNLYGEVPLILTTDYQKNATAERTPIDRIQEQIIADLKQASEVLEDSYMDGERTYINSYVAKALLARAYLYQKEWMEAESLSSEVIVQTATYDILKDFDQVFLANSQEAIWQLSPLGRGNSFTNTNEGDMFIYDTQSITARFKLSDDLVDSFSEGDKRLLNWIGYNGERGLYFSHKYKIRNSTAQVTEYSMVLRLAEQFLIRAEARAMQGKLAAAIADVDIIRGRAGIPLIATANPGINKEALLDTILKERRRELFTEWGHRWNDIRRNEMASEVFGAKNPLWEDTDILYPIPEGEREKNPNLEQNTGY